MKLMTLLLLQLILIGCGLQGCYLGCTNGVDLIYIDENLKGDTRQIILQHEDCHITLGHKGSIKKDIEKEIEADLCAEERVGISVCQFGELLDYEGYYEAAQALNNRSNCGV